MKKIGLFYATKAERTSWVAEKIQKEFGEDKIEVVPIEQDRKSTRLSSSHSE